VKAPTQPDAIVGRYEIGQIVEVSRQGVESVVSHPDFPAPICFQGKRKAPLFWRRDVLAFKDRRDREKAAADKAAAEKAEQAAVEQAAA
jgi:hypothetical protein